MPMNMQEITAIKGLSEAKADKMLETARKMLPSAGWQTGTEMAQGRALKVLKIKVRQLEIMHAGMERRQAGAVCCTWRRMVVHMVACVPACRPTWTL